MSSCNLPADTWWGITLWDHRGFDEEVTGPQIVLKFNNKSASFTYQGWFSMNTDPGNNMLDNGDTERDILQGLVTIDFLGSIDAERSDVLDDGSSSNISSEETGNAGTNRLGLSLGWCIFSLFIAYVRMFS
ncbi:hypothetical protein FALCPG4_018142 [Fusarium falciforme]